MVHHTVRHSAPTRIVSNLPLARRAELHTTLSTPTDVRIRGTQDYRRLRSLVIHHKAVGKTLRFWRERHHADATMHRKRAAPVRPVLRLLRRVPNDLRAGQVRGLCVEAEFADELHAG